MTRADALSPLGQLAGAYFHQDWLHEAPTWQGIVAQYVSENPVVFPVGAMGELSLVISVGVADTDDYMYEAFGMYDRPRVGEAGTSWLVEIRAEIGNCLVVHDRLPPTNLADVLDRLRLMGVAGADDDGFRHATRFGETAPHDEVVALLGAVSVALAPAAATDPETRRWLEQVRTTIAEPAARRWPIIAQAL